MARGNKRTIYLGLDYTDFTGGVTEVNRKMTLLDEEFKLAQEQAKNYGTETDKLGIKQDYLGQKIALQTQKVEAAKKAYEEATKAQGTSSKQIDALEKNLLKERTALEKLNGKLSEANEITESFGDEIRGIASSLGLEVSPALEAFASKFDGISKDLGNSIILIGGIISGLTSFAIEAAGTADELLTLSKVTGVSTDELQKFQYASKFLDVSTESMSDALKELTNKMYDARNGSSEAQTAFRKLHLSIKDGNGQMKDANEMFYETIDALGQIKNQTERDAVAMKLFGESARNLNPLIEAGSDKLRQLGIEAENLGVVMGEDSINKLGRLQDAMDKFDATSESLKNNLALAVLPILTNLFEVIGAIPVPVLEAITMIGMVAITIVSVVKAIKSMTDTASGIKKFFSGFDTSAFKTTGIVLGVVAALVALAAIIAVIMGKSNELDRSMNTIGNSIGKVTSSVNQARNGVYQTSSYASGATNLNFKLREHKEGVYSTQLHASGTENFRGGRTWVGEAGPEIVELPPGTRIHSNEESMGRTVNYYNITVTLREMKELIEMREYFDRRQLEERRGK